jgi:hypothetical protein
MNVLSKFPLGQIFATQGALDSLSMTAINRALDRHASGDWGQVCEDDRATNEVALIDGSRLLSAYRSGGLEYWIITEADRSATTLLLPSDY